MENIHSIFRNNGYPENVIKRTIKRRDEKFMFPPMFGPGLCRSVLSCVFVRTRAVFDTAPAFSSLVNNGPIYNIVWSLINLE